MRELIDWPFAIEVAQIGASALHNGSDEIASGSHRPRHALDLHAASLKLTSGVEYPEKA